MIKVVFDTVVFLRSLINPSSRFGKLVSFQNRYQLFVSPEVAKEYFDVLHRPELTKKFRETSELDLERVIGLITEAPVVEIGSFPAVSRDPKDDKFLATAERAKADCLVSEDRDLLDLKSYKGIKILTTSEFLRVLEEI